MTTGTVLVLTTKTLELLLLVPMTYAVANLDTKRLLLLILSLPDSPRSGTTVWGKECRPVQQASSLRDGSTIVQQMGN